MPLCALVLGLLLVPRAAFPAPDILRVLDYNIWQWHMGVARLETLIRACRANIVGLQEAWSVTDNNRLAARLGWSIAYGGLDGAGGKNQKFWINGYHMPQVLTSAFPMEEKRYFNILDKDGEGRGTTTPSR